MKKKRYYRKIDDLYGICIRENWIHINLFCYHKNTIVNSGTCDMCENNRYKVWRKNRVYLLCNLPPLKKVYKFEIVGAESEQIFRK